MNELARALLQRLFPGQSPEIPLPPQSVMDPAYRDPLARREAERGAGRGLLDLAGGLPDTVTAGINRVPGLPGALVRGALGKNPLPTDAVAPALGVQGSGPAFEFGRAGGNAIGAAAGLGAATKPTQGQVNMLLGRGAPGYDRALAKQIAEQAASGAIKTDDRSLARFAQMQGQVYDPNARQMLQYLDTSDWKFRPELQRELAGGKEVPFGGLFQGTPGKGKLPPRVLDTPVQMTLGVNGGAEYNSGTKRIGLSLESLSSEVNKRDHIFHEGQHAVQDVLGLSQGTNPNAAYWRERALQDIYLKKQKQLFVAGLSNGKMPLRFTLPGRDLRNAFHSAETASMRNLGEDSYLADVGEQVARAAAQVSFEGIPLRGRGLNVYNNPDVSAEPGVSGAPQAVKNFLAQAQARHPELFKKLMASYPEFHSINKNERLFQELLGARPYLGIPGVPSPLREELLSRRPPTTP
jgi:hypothetical protein